MDTGRGAFKMMKHMEELEKLQKEHPNHGGTFAVGEELEIKGSRFKVTRIDPKKMTLRLLPRKEKA